MAVKKSKELTEALSWVVTNQPFFAHLLMDLMKLVEAEDYKGTAIPTAATDGHVIITNPKWFNPLKLEERVFVLCHEIAHAIFQHMPRAKLYTDRGLGPDLKPFSHVRWNKAGDYVINRWLTEISLGKMPMEGLYNPNITANDIVDDVYYQLPDEEDPPGGGHGGHDTHLAPDNQGPTAPEVKRAVAGAAANAKAMGKEPGGMERIVGDLMEPKITWQDKLRSKVSATLGNDESTWSRPNRRRLAMSPHTYMPGTRGNRTGVAVIEIDTSGSVAPAELDAFRTEVAGILQDCRPERCIVLWVDSEVAGVDELEDPAEIVDLKAKGGGGTDMRVGVQWCIDNDLYPDHFICLTDGGTPWPDKAPFPTLWVITNEHIEAPIGESIFLDIKS
jgi:predicted metal-dependent peptidase